MSTDLQRCTRCVIPETHETIAFDAQGVCNVCRQHEYKHEQIDWQQRRQDLETLIAAYRGKYAYDCLVPFSGGKDSTFTLYYLVTTYKLKPLVVQFDHGFLRPQLRQNNERTLKKLGVDVISFRPNWHIVRKLMLESLKRKGDFCWHCHTGIFAYPMQIAVKFNVPLLFWGEPSAEYTSYYSYDEPEEVDERRFNRFVNLGMTADDMLGMLDGVEARDLEPFRYPPLKDLRRLQVRSVCLGSYIPWDVKHQVAVIQHELGWQGDAVEGVPGMYDYEKIECFMQGVRDYLKFIKRGYGRTAHLTSLDIRHDRLHRDEALRLSSAHDGKRPASLDLFLRYVGISEQEFMEIAQAQAVHPWQYDPTRTESGQPLPDMAQWDRTFHIIES
ncbi:MAG: N-acetyl sugar amidotransferase [Candidatus Tectimicrobiota bacterium]